MKPNPLPVVLLLMLTGCGSSNDADKIARMNAAAQQLAQEAKPTYQPGDIVTLRRAASLWVPVKNFDAVLRGGAVCVEPAEAVAAAKRSTHARELLLCRNAEELRVSVVSVGDADSPLRARLRLREAPGQEYYVAADDVSLLRKVK